MTFRLSPLREFVVPRVGLEPTIPRGNPLMRRVQLPHLLTSAYINVISDFAAKPWRESNPTKLGHRTPPHTYSYYRSE